MGSSAKKKKEKAQDFKKTRLKVGKARPKNTNATDTSFTAKSIILKQQSLTESHRSPPALFAHNLSLLSSKTSTQRHDALAHLASTLHTTPAPWPQPPSLILAKAQPLILDGDRPVRTALLRLLRSLPPAELGPLDATLLYMRAGLTHLSTEIRLSALEMLDWLLEVQGEGMVSSAGGWIKMLKTFQNVLSWTGSPPQGSAAGGQGKGEWSSAKPTGTLGSSKLLVHQLTTLSAFLAAGLTQTPPDPHALAVKAAETFPLVQVAAHALPSKGNSYGYLNLFGAPRDLEGEIYDGAEERREAFVEAGLRGAFELGVAEARGVGGEVGRASGGVGKALRLVEVG